MARLIIRGNEVYEIDEECLRRKGYGMPPGENAQARGRGARGRQEESEMPGQKPGRKRTG